MGRYIDEILQPGERPRNSCPSLIVSRRRYGSTFSAGARRLILITIARDIGVGQIAESGEGDGTVSGQLFGHNRLAPDHTTARHRAATVPRIQEPRISSLSFAFGPNRVSISS